MHIWAPDSRASQQHLGAWIVVKSRDGRCSRHATFAVSSSLRARCSARPDRPACLATPASSSSAAAAPPSALVSAPSAPSSGAASCEWREANRASATARSWPCAGNKTSALAYSSMCSASHTQQTLHSSRCPGDCMHNGGPESTTRGVCPPEGILHNLRHTAS